ncbi:MAG: YggT family protein [Candidatus Omnitrophica bacterium]|nr:YggT family protein [Candidatus Omnitrophota bacterium]
MFILSNFILSLAKIADVILTIFYWLVLVRALVSWVNPDPLNTIVQLLYRTTEPILQPIRRLLPVSVIDFSPIVAFLVILFLKSFIVPTLIDVGYRIR